jgi:DNA-binding response OmpR family regulator
VKETLELSGYEVLHHAEGTNIKQAIQQFSPDLCILDVMLPNIDGFSLGSLIRELKPSLPIIFLTAKTQTSDVVKGFSSGGNDYLKKPFSMEELMVRIENQWKHSIVEMKKETQISQEIILGRFFFYPGRYELKTDTTIKKLSNRESQILNMLCTYRNRPLDRKKLLIDVWGDDSFFNSRNLDVYIAKLREYLSSETRLQIITLKGIGYHFAVPEDNI